MTKEERKEIAAKLKHAVYMYRHTDSDSDREYLGRILFYAGVLAGEAL